MDGQPAAAIVGVGVAVPDGRLPVAEIASAWGRSAGRGQVAACGPDEDTLTLAWQAAELAMRASSLEPNEVDGLWWGTTRAPFAEGPSWVQLAAALRLEGSAEGTVISGSAHAGIDALVAARDALAAGRVTRAVVVTSDALVPGAGSSCEAACGAGAAAVILAAGEEPAALGTMNTRWRPVLDRYRGTDERATRDVYDPRLFREEIFLPLLTECATTLGPAPKSARWSMPDPDGRLGGALAHRLGVAAEHVSSTESRQSLGDLGAAAPLAGLVPALVEPGPAVALAYGAGRATALSVDVTTAVPGAVEATAALAAPARTLTYAEVLRARGQLVANGENVEMAIPPGSAMFVRGTTEVLGLFGARCVECATVSFPPSIHPACIGCGADKFDLVPLARTGTVQTFVVNHAMPAPFVAPLPLVCVDLDDGVRVMFQGTTSAAGIGIGDLVELVLRRYTVERGVPIYGWKVQPR